jgi:integrase
MAINIFCRTCKSTYKLNSKKCPSCGSTERKDRAYRVRLRQDGKQKSRVFPTLELSRDAETKWRSDILRGEEAITRKKPVLPLNEFWTKHYLPWAKNNKKSWEADQSRYNQHIKPALGNKPMDKVITFDIEKLLSGMRNKNSVRGRKFAPATLKEVIALLSLLFTLSRKWGFYKGSNPCELVHKPKVNNLQTEYLTHHQHADLLKTLDTWPDRMTASIIRFAMFTGIRRGELFKLQWQDISFEHGTMVLRDPKGMRDVSLPLSKEALEVIQRVPKKYETDYIFYGKDGRQRTDFKHAWHTIRKAAGLPDDFRFHGLRHHFASSLVSNGFDLYVVQQLLTHKSYAMTQRYSHLSPNVLRQATNKAGKLLSGKVPVTSDNMVRLNNNRR